MIYICSEVRNNAPATSAFVAKGLTGYTQGRLRDITLFGKPTRVQVAFSGYKDNIEAFLFATATKTKVITSAEQFPIPTDYVPSFPLRYPVTIFRLAKKPTADQLKRMKDGLEKYGLEEVQIGKGDPSFVLRNPQFIHLAKTLPAICLPRTGTIDATAQLEASVALLRVYQCIDLFLATNTYSYRKGDNEGKWANDHKDYAANRMEQRVNGYWYRPGYGEEQPQASESITSGERRRIDDVETTDLTPHRGGQVPMSTSVYVAKPSPHPSSTSWGRPSSVPNKPGLLFPYFPGMMGADTIGLRELCSEHLFRNFGSSTEDCRAAFIQFRKIVGTAGSTPEGVVLCHVMKGLSLALQTQTQLYLLFDGTDYLGFCLLGEEFSIFIHGKWWTPLTAASLKSELKTLRTHDKSLDDLVARLKKCTTSAGDIIDVTKEDISTCDGLADALAQIHITGDHDHDEEDVAEILARLSLPTTYKSYSVSGITWAIDELTARRDQPFPNAIPFYIPLKGWTGISSKEYKVLASFGTRGPSFRNAKGTEVNVPKPGETDKMEQKDEKGKYVREEIIIGEKVIPEAIKDWMSLRSMRSVRMDFAERARGSRNHVFRRNNGLNEIWGRLKEAAAAGLLGDLDIASVPNVEKRSFDNAFGSGSLDDAEF